MSIDDESCNNVSIKIFASIVSIFLVVSESLPFVKKIESNGILHFIISHFKDIQNAVVENEKNKPKEDMRNNIL